MRPRAFLFAHKGLPWLMKNGQIWRALLLEIDIPSTNREKKEEKKRKEKKKRNETHLTVIDCPSREGNKRKVNVTR